MSAPRRNARGTDRLPLHRLGSGRALPKTAYVALVPGAQAPVLPLDLPPGLKGVTRERVARRQMADLFGAAKTDLEMRPVALAGPKTPWTRALVVAPKDRQAWVGEIAPAKSSCRAVLPDYLALPTAPDIWTIEVADGQIRARLGPDDGFTAEPALALALLTAALADGTPKAVLRLGAVDPALDSFLAGNKLKTETDAARLGAKIFAFGELTLDLARDPDAEIDDMRRAVRPFLMPAVMAVLALGMWSGATMKETGELRAKALSHRKNAEAILRDTMIPTGPILDIRAQVTGVLDDRRTAADLAAARARPLDVFRAAGEVLTGTDALIEAVGYQPGSGLIIDLRVSDFAELDQLVAALRDAGIELTVAQSTARENEGVEASLALVSDRGGRR